MTPDAWQKLSTMLDRLLELPPAERRKALDTLRDTDPTLCAEVESLLTEEQAGDRFETPPSMLLADLPTVADEPTFDAGKAGRYEILEEIARGGMGVVRRARDAEIGRLLAVKTLLPRARSFPDADRWFDREARITGRLQHPGIPPVHEMGRLADGSPFFVMKLIEGRTLTQVIRDADWPARAVGVFEQVSSTLAYAHSRGIIHRDLKPGNVMVGAFGEVQVMDWGLAKSLRDAADGDAAAGGVVGTPAYMAPEQARGEPDLDERCDVFGLGALLCAMLTGKPPYKGATPQETLKQAADAETAAALAALADAGADADLIAVAKRCLAAARRDRYRNAGEVAAAVTAYRVGVAERLRQTELARAEAVVKAAEERRRRRVTLSLVAALAVLALGAVGVWAWQDRLKTATAARATDLNRQIGRALDAADGERRIMTAALGDPPTANKLLSNLQPWRSRLHAVAAAAAQARQLADSDAGLVDPGLAGRLAALEAAVAADAADYAFAERFDALRLDLFEPDLGRTPRKLETAYAEFFRRHGLDARTAPADALAARLAGSPLRLVAVAAFDDWARVLLLGTPRDDAGLEKLLALNRRLDPDTWRDRFRRPAVWTDAKQAAAVTADVACEEQSPQVLRVAADVRSHHRLDAAAFLDRALRAYPADFWLHYQHGFTTFTADPAASLGAYRAALALRPDNALVLSNAAIAYGKRQEFATSEHLLRRAIQLRPADAAAVNNLGKCLYEQGDYAAAAAEYRRSLALDDAEPTCHNNLGAALCAVGEYAEALACFDRALSLQPANRGAQANRQQIAGVAARRAPLAGAEAGPAGTPERLAAGVAGTLTAQHPLDWVPGPDGRRRAGYRVELAAGAVVQFDVAAAFDVGLRVEDDRFQPLAAHSERRPGDGKKARVVFAAPAAGVYRVVVLSAAAGQAGSFTLRGRPTAAVGEPLRRVGTLTRQDALVQGRHVHKVPVTLTAGRPAVVRLDSRAFLTTVWLADPTGNTHYAFNDKTHPHDPHWSRLDFTPTASGPYLVYVTADRPDRVGAYTLTVTQYRDLDAKDD